MQVGTPLTVEEMASFVTFSHPLGAKVSGVFTSRRTLQVCVCVRACVCACVRVCVCACNCLCVAASYTTKTHRSTSSIPPAAVPTSASFF